MQKQSVSKRSRGCPNRIEASRKALEGIDIGSCDPIKVLQEIAMDRSVSALARVSAAKALLRAFPPADDAMAGPDADLDPITRRAIASLARGRPN
jgi:hypothetical protein